MDRPPDSPPPTQDTVTYLFTTRRLVVLGVLCAVLGVLILGHLGGKSLTAAAPSPTVLPPATSEVPFIASAAPAPVSSVPHPITTAQPAAAPTAAPAPGAAGQTGVPRGTPATVSTVNRADATAVGEAFVTTSFSYDTTIDVSPADAQRRSIPFATPGYAAQLRAVGTLPGGDRWNTLAEHHGYTTTTLAENHDQGRPPDTAAAAVRSWTVTTTGRGPDSWTAPMGTALVFVTMNRTDQTAPWQVSGVQIPSAN